MQSQLQYCKTQRRESRAAGTVGPELSGSAVSSAYGRARCRSPNVEAGAKQGSAAGRAAADGCIPGRLAWRPRKAAKNQFLELSRTPAYPLLPHTVTPYCYPILFLAPLRLAQAEKGQTASRQLQLEACAPTFSAPSGSLLVQFSACLFALPVPANRDAVLCRARPRRSRRLVVGCCARRRPGRRLRFPVCVQLAAPLSDPR